MSEPTKAKPPTFHQISLSDEQGQPSAPRRIAWWQAMAAIALVAIGVVASFMGKDRVVKFIEYAIGVLGTGTGAALLWAQIKSAIALYGKQPTPTTPTPPKQPQENASS